MVPAWVWRGGPVRRAVSVGLPAGLFFGAFVLAESGSWFGAAVAVLVLGPFHGIWVARRMARVWPGAAHLDAADRVAVVHASRRGENIGQARLARAVIEYGDGLRQARAHGRLFASMVLLFAGLALALALIDTVTGTMRETAVSWAFVALVLLELTCWPGSRRTCCPTLSGRRDRRGGYWHKVDQVRPSRPALQRAATEEIEWRFANAEHSSVKSYRLHGYRPDNGRRR